MSPARGAGRARVPADICLGVHTGGSVCLGPEPPPPPPPKHTLFESAFNQIGWMWEMRDYFHTCLLSALTRDGICISTPLTLSPESERMWPLTGREQPGPLRQVGTSMGGRGAVADRCPQLQHSEMCPSSPTDDPVGAARREPEPRRRFSATQSRARAAFGSQGILVSATSQLLQEGRHNRQPQTSQPAAWEFNTQLDLLAARAVKLVSAAAEKAAVFSSPVSSLGCIRLFSGNFAVGVNLLDLDLSNIHL